MMKKEDYIDNECIPSNGLQATNGIVSRAVHPDGGKGGPTWTGYGRHGHNHVLRGYAPG